VSGPEKEIIQGHDWNENEKTRQTEENWLSKLQHHLMDRTWTGTSRVFNFRASPTYNIPNVNVTPDRRTDGQTTYAGITRAIQLIAVARRLHVKRSALVTSFFTQVSNC